MKSDLADIDLNIILVNDGSDNGHFVPHEIQIKLPGVKWISYHKNRGKGYALRQGIKKSDSDFIVFTDLDFPYGEASMKKLIKALLANKGDIIIGERDESYLKNISFQRRVVSTMLKKMIILFVRIPFHDTQAGLKGFHSGIKEVFLRTRTDRFLFDLEFLKMAVKKKLRIRVVPVKLRSGIKLPSVSWKVLVIESFNFIKIIFNR